jgi:antitoxin component YwqK of YwqJK toxin-antitoxin module
MEEIQYEYYKNGTISRKKWIVNNKFHRLDGPAYIYYYQNGSIEYKSWIVESELHRLDGPAYISYHEDGSRRYEHWFVNGIGIGDPLWLKENGIIDPLSDEDLVAIKLRWG